MGDCIQTIMRLNLALIFCSSLALAQGRPDFTGVYLRNHQAAVDYQKKHGVPLEIPPLVLEVHQTADQLRVVQYQNGAQRSLQYELDAKKAQVVDSDGFRYSQKARLRRGKLMIEYHLEPETARSRIGPVNSKESWELSSDGRTLTIMRNAPDPDQFPVEVYDLQPSLKSALARADSESEMNRCLSISSQKSRQKEFHYKSGALLGATYYQQFEQSVGFNANLAAPFFTGLVRTDRGGVTEFTKDGNRVEYFPDSLVGEIGIAPPSPMVSTPVGMILLPSPKILPDGLHNLRFLLKWTGAVDRDLGELRSDFFQEAWTELRAPEMWYRVQIPSKDVPLNDSLEIHILNKDGKQLGCISGHI